MDQNVPSKRSTSSGPGKIAAKSHDAAEQLKEAVVDQAHQVRDQAESAKQHTTERIRGVAKQLQTASQTLNQEDPWVADLAERASRQVDAVADYVSHASAQSIVSDTESLARRQPALFFGGAFLLGLAAGRFLKSSSPSGSSWPRQNEADYSAPRLPREARASGFFPQGESNVVNQRRYQENYAAAFDSDVPERPVPERPVSERPVSERPVSTPNVGVGKAASKGSLP